MDRLEAAGAHPARERSEHFHVWVQHEDDHLVSARSVHYLQSRMSELTADAIFSRHFLPLYPPEQQADLRELVGARYTDAVPVAGVDLERELAAVADRFAVLAPKALGRDLRLDFSDASIHRLGAALTREARDAAIAQGELAPLVIHGAVYVAATAVRAHGATFRPRRPLWETAVTLESRAGRGDLAPFHWFLKALSDAEIDQGGLTTRWVQHVERARLDPTTLRPFLREARALPPLKVVRYDTLHKYLRAHLGELRDVGRDFPSPERFDELGFLSLEFLVLGGGRLLLLHGRGRAGLHLFWLDADGFSHARCFPADPASPHRVAVDGDKLELHFSREGAAVDDEILYWG